MKELKFNLKLLFKRKELYITFLIILILSFIHFTLSVLSILNNNSFIELIPNAEYRTIISTRGIDFITILVVVIPIILSTIFSDTNYLDNKRKTTNILYPRINIKKNIISRCLICLIIPTIICFVCFMYNYFSLRIVLGSGNQITIFQETAFNLVHNSSYFLDEIRLNNPCIYIIISSFTISLLYGVLNMISYVISLFIKNRIIIYFIPIIFMILFEQIVTIFKLNITTINVFLTAFTAGNIISYLTCIFSMIFISIILLIIYFRKRDVLL